MTYDMSQIILFFYIYSVFGWVCEVIYCSVPAKRFINRGFLNGPYCPIYGTGAVLIIVCCRPFAYNPLLLFIVSVLLTTIVEYITSWLMETLFQMKWWDYSEQKFQLNGRICLKNSLLFGLLSLFLIYAVHPLAQQLIFRIPVLLQKYIVYICTAGWLVDAVLTLNSLNRMKVWLGKTHQFVEELKQHEKWSEWVEKRGAEGSLSKLLETIKNEAREKEPYILKQLEQILERKKYGSRLANAFPNLKPKGMDKAMKLFRENWKRRK